MLVVGSYNLQNKFKLKKYNMLRFIISGNRLLKFIIVILFIFSSVNMFGNCKSLTGAVPFDSTKTDVSMANYTTGYLTYKSNN